MPEPIIHIQYVYPEPGLITKCYKPKVTGVAIEQTPEDVFRLKAALGKCAGQVDEYLEWRASEAETNR